MFGPNSIIYIVESIDIGQSSGADVGHGKQPDEDWSSKKKVNGLKHSWPLYPPYCPHKASTTHSSTPSGSSPPKQRKPPRPISIINGLVTYTSQTLVSCDSTVVK